MDIAIRKNWFGQLVGVVQDGLLQPTDYLCLSVHSSSARHRRGRFSRPKMMLSSPCKILTSMSECCTVHRNLEILFSKMSQIGLSNKMKFFE